MKNGTPSLISNNLTVTGNLKTEGEVQIDGVVEGDVACGSLTIGESATISGEVAADRVIVHGKVVGRIRARSVQLARSAHIEGDIWHDELSMEAGAFLEGHCKRNDAKTTASAAPRPAAPAEAPKEPAAAAGGARA